MLTLVYARHRLLGVRAGDDDLRARAASAASSRRSPSTTPSGCTTLAVVLSALAYLAFKAIGRTNFGLALQGVRDDPVRMGSLGFNVALHRTLAFTLAGFFAGVAGVLNVWWRGQIDPASISIAPDADPADHRRHRRHLVLRGRLGRVRWSTSCSSTYTTSIPLIDRIGLTPDRFNTIIGLCVLLIMVLSPEGLVGIVERLRSRPRRSASPASTRSNRRRPRTHRLRSGLGHDA